MNLDNLLPRYLGSLFAPKCFFDRLLHRDMVSFGLYASLKKMHDKDIIQYIDSIWDVGANEGQFAFMANKIWPTLPLYSFEPDPVTYQKLISNFRKFNIYGETFCLALGDSLEKKRLMRYKSNANNSLLARVDIQDDATESVEVNCTKLDEVAKNFDFQAAFLKLDVQGYENIVLSGAKQFLNKCLFVQIEVAFSLAYSGAVHAGEIITTMHDYGFECIEILDLLRDKNHKNRILEADLLFKRMELNPE